MRIVFEQTRLLKTPTPVYQPRAAKGTESGGEMRLQSSVLSPQPSGLSLGRETSDWNPREVNTPV